MCVCGKRERKMEEEKELRLIAPRESNPQSKNEGIIHEQASFAFNSAHSKRFESFFLNVRVILMRSNVRAETDDF